MDDCEAVDYKQQKDADKVSPDLHCKRKENSDKSVINLSSLRETMRTLSLKCCTMLRGLAFALAIPKSTLHDNLKKLGLRSVSR